MIRVALVIAVARNGVIGVGGALPWRIADDLKFFRRVTLGKPVVMGRKTFVSIGRPLPGRANIVVTRDPDFSHDGVHRAGDVNAGIALARQLARETGADEVCVIGGAEIYRQAEAVADRIYLTEVDAEPAGDTYWFVPARSSWRVECLGSAVAGGSNAFDCAFFRLDRVAEK